MKNIFLIIIGVLSPLLFGQVIVTSLEFVPFGKIWAVEDEGEGKIRLQLDQDEYTSEQQPYVNIEIEFRKLKTAEDGSGITYDATQWELVSIEPYSSTTNLQLIKFKQISDIGEHTRTYIDVDFLVAANSAPDDPREEKNGASATTFSADDNSLLINQSWYTHTQRCTADPMLTGAELTTQIGISTLDRGTDDSWVTGSQGGFIKLESKTLGFVPTRMTTDERDAIGTQAEEGMVIYNTETECLELYTGTEWICTRNKCKS